MDKNKIFHPDLITETVSAIERLREKGGQIFRPDLVQELGFDPNNQEACSMVSLMFKLDLVNGYKLSKGRNGGVVPVDAESEPKETGQRRCKRCGEAGHNVRTCKVEVSGEELVEEELVEEESVATEKETENTVQELPEAQVA